MIAVPTMSFNAMEHWGLITCREESMFYEEGVSSASDMEWTAVLVAHETSHQASFEIKVFQMFIS